MEFCGSQCAYPVLFAALDQIHCSFVVDLHVHVLWMERPDKSCDVEDAIDSFASLDDFVPLADIDFDPFNPWVVGAEGRPGVCVCAGMELYERVTQNIWPF